MIYNVGQQNIINEAVQWYRNSSNQVFQISGGPGTGKSVVLNAIVDTLGIDRKRVMAMSFTGSASMVMRLKGFDNAKTICSQLFHAVESVLVDSSGIPVLDSNGKGRTALRFVPKEAGMLKDIDLMVIDEGGSCPMWAKSVIEKHGIKVLVAGDLDQLPPVKDEPAYLYNGEVHVLTEIMRQGQGSSIPYLADRAKRGLPIHCGYYGDVWVIEDTDITDELLLNADVIICGKNSTRDYYNNYIRDLYGYKWGFPMMGEKVVCRKNNWNIEVDGISLSNGLTGFVDNTVDASVFDGETFNMNFRPLIMPNILFHDINANYKYFKADHKLRNTLRDDKFLKGERFELAYAITTHIAQGSQYRRGIYFEEYLSPQINNNLNYTGITRFSDTVIYVKRHRKFY